MRIIVEEKIEPKNKIKSKGNKSRARERVNVCEQKKYMLCDENTLEIGQRKYLGEATWRTLQAP